MGAESLRPETHALDALIQASVLRLDGVPVANDAMLFVGNHHEAFPAQVIQDPLLEPVDKIVWMVIKLSARGSARSAEFPSYVDIARQANIAARSTVARTIAILRMTRWLSLCARLREPCGRFRRNIYALHDEPVPLADALHFDPQYLHFLNDALTHNHARVRSVARGVLETFDQNAATQHDDGNATSLFEHPSAVAAALSGDARRDVGFSSVALKHQHRFNHQDRNSVMEKPPHGSDVKKSNSRCSSGLLLSEEQKPKTTTTGRLKFELPAAVDDDPVLVFPNRFSANQRDLAARHLSAVPVPLRQCILDETEGRFRAERRGMPAVYDDLRFLAALCRAALRGEFEANLGLKVAAERQAQQAEREQRIALAAAAQRDPLASKTTAQASLASLRVVLGMAKPELGHTVSKHKAD